MIKYISISDSLTTRLDKVRDKHRDEKTNNLCSYTDAIEFLIRRRKMDQKATAINRVELI